jgi:prepilin-type N-terminal cleavage/methylation domain-containing protein
MMNKQIGFTLIELAMVLVIIGLLMGMVLKGQELINSAKVKNMAADFKNVQMYMYAYQDKFRALPGDHRVASELIAGAQNGSGGTLGNGRIEGVWNAAASPPSSESEVFWQHVRLAGIAAGSTNLGDALYYPVNADGGIIGIESVNGFSGPAGLSGAFVVCSAAVPGRLAKQLDITLDDGAADRGAFRVYVDGGTVWLSSSGEGALEDGMLYNACMAF